MRVSMLVVVLATLTAIPDPVRADDYGDLDQCRFVGQIGRADRSIAACDRVLGDAKLAAPSRVAALSSRCGWWWTKKDPDRALPDCDEAIPRQNRLAPIPWRDHRLRVIASRRRTSRLLHSGEHSL